jgi:CheY-like chemotaxis protein
MILCLVDDLFFSTKISTAAKALGVPVAFERSAENVLARVHADRPALVIVDLNSGRLRPMECIAAVKADPELRGTRMLGFVAHADRDAIAAARTAGADDVLARSAFVQKLGDILSGAT